jgi:hypothetical protein
VAGTDDQVAGTDDQVAGTDDQVLVVYAAAPGTPSVEALDMLGVAAVV